jgi:hypothetical protein
MLDSLILIYFSVSVVFIFGILTIYGARARSTDIIEKMRRSAFEYIYTSPGCPPGHHYVL